MSRSMRRAAAVFVPLALLAVSCTEDEDPTASTDTPTEEPTDATGVEPEAATIDYEAIGLWDDGPCDESLPPLTVGLQTVFESPVISLGDQALALEVSAEAFNRRGGANGACIVVHNCDDGADPNQAIECVREIQEAGVVATINDQTTQGQAEVAAAMSEAGIPRVAPLITPSDWSDPNTYALDAGGTSLVFILPEALIAAGATELGTIRVDVAGAAVLPDLLSGIYDGEATFDFDTAVAAGTTDYTQYLLAAEEAGVQGAVLALGENEAIQIIRAGQQLNTDIKIGAILGSLSHAQVSELGEFAENVIFAGSYPPATTDLPVYEALRDDLISSGEESLQLENLKASPMRSWIGLYALLRMIRDAGLTDFTTSSITSMLDQATDVPMLDMFGGEDWTPALDHQGLIARSGVSYRASYRWDPEAEAVGGLTGDFVPVSETDFDAVLCGSPLGAPEPC